MRREAFIIAALGWLLVASPLTADDRSELATKTREVEQFETRLKEIRSRADALIRNSKDLRVFDEGELRSLINEMCTLDVTKRGDNAFEKAEDMTETAQKRVKDKHDDLVGKGEKLKTDASYYQDQFEDLLEAIEDLTERPAVKDDAVRLLDRAGRLWTEAKKVFEELNAEQNTISRVADGTMLGANHPLIKASLVHGIEMHERLQREWRCDAVEFAAGGGSADCVVLDQCRVIEFKPSTHSISDAESQVERYVPDVSKAFKDHSKVKATCKFKNDLPVFEGTVITYPACKP
jgi:hypothetical protein